MRLNFGAPHSPQSAVGIHGGDWHFRPVPPSAGSESLADVEYRNRSIDKRACAFDLVAASSFHRCDDAIDSRCCITGFAIVMCLHDLATDERFHDHGAHNGTHRHVGMLARCCEHRILLLLVVKGAHDPGPAAL